MSVASDPVQAPAGPERLARTGSVHELLVALLVLAMVFAVPIVFFDALRHPFMTFHGSDETIFHYPVVMEFIRQFPHFNLHDYNSATTPLFYMVLATIGTLFDSRIEWLRGFNVLVSLGAAWWFYVLCRRTLGLDHRTGLCGAVVFALSPYFYGISFRLLTDNLAILLALPALVCAWEFKRSARTSQFLWAAALTTAAILTRQFYVWIVLLLLAVLLMSRLGWAHKAALLGVLALALLPLLLLIRDWGGLSPPAFHKHTTTDVWSNLRVLGFFLSCIGLYTLLLATSRQTLIDLVHYQKGLRLFAGCVLASVAWLIVWPIQFGTINNVPTDGYLWRISSHLPSWRGSGVLFLLLMPIGLHALVEDGLLHKTHSFAVLVAVSFLIPVCASAYMFQKYYDLVALIVALALSARRQLPFRNVALLFTAGLFVAYAVTVART